MHIWLSFRQMVAMKFREKLFLINHNHLTMKAILSFATGIIFTCSLVSCKKNVQPDSIPPPGGQVNSFASSPTANTVRTIAGQKYSSGKTLIDGPALIARFYTPSGLFLTESGIFYVADRRNNAVRQILNGQVSTIPLGPNRYGDTPREPQYIGISRVAGDIHLICAVNPDGDPYGQSWIYGAGGNFVASTWSTYTSRACLARDPYNDFFWTSTGMQIYKHKATSEDDIDKDRVPYPDSLLDENDNHRGSVYRGMYVGYNNVKYLGVNDHMFKLTSSGVFARIYAELNLGNITSIIGSRDSRTIYIAADGYIKRIYDNKLTVLAGPNAGFPDGRDGIGMMADVHANSLVLAKGENIIYFTDTFTNTIRQLSLK